MVRLSPGIVSRRRASARAPALTMCESIVTNTTLIGVFVTGATVALAGLAGKMRFSVIQRLQGNHVNGMVCGVALGVAPRLASNEEGNLCQFAFGHRVPRG